MKVPLSSEMLGSTLKENMPETSPLDRNVQVGNVVQHKLDKLLVFLLTDMADE